jgi:hypothetical protein
VGVKSRKIHAPFIPPPNLPPLEGGALILHEKMWAMISLNQEGAGGGFLLASLSKEYLPPNFVNYLYPKG